MSKSCISYSIAGCPTNYQQNPLQTVKFYYDHDINVVPIQPGTKLPLVPWKDYQEQRQTWSELARMNWRGGLAGINGVSGVLSLDFDHAPFFAPIGKLLTALGLPIDYPWVSRSGYGYHVWIKCVEELILDGVLKTRYVGSPRDPLAAGYEWQHHPDLPFKQLEIRRKDCFTILPPTPYPASDKRYEWLHSHSFPDQELAIVTSAQIAAAFFSIAILDSTSRPPTLHHQAPLPPALATPLASLTSSRSNYVAAALKGELSKLASAVEGTRNSQLFRSTASLAELIPGGHLAQNTVVEALTRAAQSTGLDDREIVSTIRSGLNTGMLHPRTIPQGEIAGLVSTINPPLDANITAQLLSFDADDTGNARAVLLLYRDYILYTDASGWLHWNGTYWKRDKAAVKRKVIDTLRKRKSAAAAAEMDFIRKAAKADDNRIKGAMNVLQAYCTVEEGDFDNEFGQINVANGVLNLRTGELAPHEPTQRFTYCLSTRYNPLADYDFWEQFLLQNVKGGREVVDYLQEFIGYCLTGYTFEECLLYIFGPTRGGKGTLTETLRALFNWLSKVASFKSFTAPRSGDNQNFDFAEYKIARLIFASEGDKNERLKGDIIKSLTGGDEITCARKYKDPFSYRPQFKIILTTNWPVNADPDDKAVWGRLRVIEFPNSYLDKEDNRLKERFKQPEMLEGILLWALQGAKRWYARGKLLTPELVKQTKQAHLDSLDNVGLWIEDCCELDAQAWTSHSVLMSSYKNWCEDTNSPAKSQRGLTQSLESKNLTSERRYTGPKRERGFKGIKLI
ncbi:MAG: phage/plasmid primase, P4 family [Ktedonobacteraceae bacterium]